jgi:predicted transcriptional regulator
MKRQNNPDRSTQIIRVKEHTKHFTIILNEVLQTNEMSARAKGLYAYLISLPDDWKIYKTELTRHFTEGRDALDSAFKELEQAGYIEKAQRRNTEGQFAGYVYRVHESKYKTKALSENQLSDFQVTGNQLSENPSLQRTQKLSTDKPSTHDRFGTSNKAFELAELLEVLHKNKDPKYTGDPHRWALDIEKLVCLDGREYFEIEKVIRWCKTPENFWFAHIMSGKQLREKFPKLVAQMKAESAGHDSGNTVIIDNGPLEFEELL